MGVVREATVLVFLQLAVVGHEDALSSEFESREGAHAGQHVGDAFFGGGFDEGLAVVVLALFPLGDEASEVVDEELGDDAEVFATAVCVVGGVASAAGRAPGPSASRSWPHSRNSMA